MADKRMFSIKIVDSDAFLDMPISSQALYFHLNMRADDDGFVNNPKKICRFIGATDEDLMILVSRRFLIAFPNGVVVIKHWLINNLIRKDRHQGTQYDEYMNMLRIKENGAYTENLKNEYVESEVTEITTAIEDKEISKNNKVVNEVKEVIDLYHKICVSYPRLKTISEDRKKTIKARLRTVGIERIKEAFENCEKSDFLKGKNGRDWAANFDWIMKDRNITRIIDGNYNTKEISCNYDNAEIEEIW